MGEASYEAKSKWFCQNVDNLYITPVKPCGIIPSSTSFWNAFEGSESTSSSDPNPPFSHNAN